MKKCAFAIKSGIHPNMLTRDNNRLKDELFHMEWKARRLDVNGQGGLSLFLKHEGKLFDGFYLKQNEYM
jgi:hypothetical protein